MVVYQTQIFTYIHLIFYIHGILYTILNKCGIYSIDTKVTFKWPFIVMKLRIKNYLKGRKTERQEEKTHRKVFTPYFLLSKPYHI